MQLNLAERRENRRGDPRRSGEPLRVERLHLLFNGRFALTGDAQKPPKQPRSPDVTQETLLNDGLEHRLQLSRRPGQQHDQLSLVLDPQARCGPVPVRQHRGALRHHRLTPVDLRRPQSARGKPLLDRLEDMRVILERTADEVCDDVAREIVVCRAEPAGQDQQIGSVERVRHDRLQHVPVVARNRLTLEIDTDLVQPLGDEERVRVDVRRRQHLAADSDDFCSHIHPGAK